jgi:hypothetical protein
MGQISCYDFFHDNLLAEPAPVHPPDPLTINPIISVNPAPATTEVLSIPSHCGKGAADLDILQPRYSGCVAPLTLAPLKESDSAAWLPLAKVAQSADKSPCRSALFLYPPDAVPNIATPTHRHAQAFTTGKTRDP